MKYYQHPDAFMALRNLYWFLRYRRSWDLAARRKWYRRIRIERNNLENMGFSAEHVRLYCRYMANPGPQSPALKRLQTFEAMLAEINRIKLAATKPNYQEVVPSAIEPLRTGRAMIKRTFAEVISNE